MSAARINRGDVWLADLNPIRGRQQASTRPVVIVSAAFLQRAGLVVVVPFTTRPRRLQLDGALEPPPVGEAYLKQSFASKHRTKRHDKIHAAYRWTRGGDEPDVGCTTAP